MDIITKKCQFSDKLTFCFIRYMDPTPGCPAGLLPATA